MGPIHPWGPQSDQVLRGMGQALALCTHLRGGIWHPHLYGFFSSLPYSSPLVGFLALLPASQVCPTPGPLHELFSLPVSLFRRLTFSSHPLREAFTDHPIENSAPVPPSPCPAAFSQSFALAGRVYGLLFSVTVSRLSPSRRLGLCLILCYMNRA